MSNKYWFEPKKYGWGMVPTTIEGWLATLVLMILLLIILQTNGVLDATITDDRALRVFFDVFVVVGIFTVLMRGKVKGELKWRWPATKKKVKKVHRRKK